LQPFSYTEYSMRIISIIAGLFLFSVGANAQGFCTGAVAGQDCSEPNVITTAVPFLTIAPDSRSGAMGDAGAGISPDANAQFYNASKLAFAENEFEVSLSYSPWLRNLVNDMNLAYLAAYYKLDKRSALGASLRYFNLGNITFTNEVGQEIRDFNPNEFAFDVSYSLMLSDKFSGGITARYINSNLTGGVMVGGADSRPGQAFAVDVSVFYQNKDIRLGDKKGVFGFGAVVSNIGNKIAYTNTADRDFIPINLRLGPSLTLDLDRYNKLTFAVDFNKLLVPSPPIYQDRSSDPRFGEVVAGYDPNVGVATGIFQSFYDAPGDPVRDENGDIVYLPNGDVDIVPGSAFREELREITIGGGIEYMYAEQFAVRAGYFHEHATKGNRKFLTFGVGVAYSIFVIDFSYIAAINRINPLANTLRFSLRLRFEDLKGGGAKTPQRAPD
jgi:hypothetical protein